MLIIVWQRFEDYVVQPLANGRALKVNPPVTTVGLLIGARLLGILGTLLATDPTPTTDPTSHERPAIRDPP